MRKLEGWKTSLSVLLFSTCWCSCLFYFYSSAAFVSSFCLLIHVQSSFYLCFAFFPLPLLMEKSSLLGGGKDGGEEEYVVNTRVLVMSWSFS